jgi:hypothetical protein
MLRRAKVTFNRKRGIVMTYESPAVVEVRMDAEIGSYQDDFDPRRDEPAFVSESLSED